MGQYEHAGKHKKMDESAGKPSRGLVLILHLMGYKYGVRFLKQQQTKVKEKKESLAAITLLLIFATHLKLPYLSIIN